MRITALLTLLLAAQAAGLAQLTLEQKLTDFRQLAGLFNKRYAPYEWKKQNYQFDLLDSKPWLGIEKVELVILFLPLIGRIALVEQAGKLAEVGQLLFERELRQTGGLGG